MKRVALLATAAALALAPAASGHTLSSASAREAAKDVGFALWKKDNRKYPSWGLDRCKRRTQHDQRCTVLLYRPTARGLITCRYGFRVYIQPGDSTPYASFPVRRGCFTRTE